MRSSASYKLRTLSTWCSELALDAPDIIFVRVNAADKMRIVEALKSRAHIVAVTGDDVNDAPRTRTPDMQATWRARAEAKAAQAEAQRVVERWNAALAVGRGVLWSPTIRATIAAGTPWADVFCPGCRTSRAIDIRTIDRHPLASVGSLVLGLRCSWCPGSAPMPRITELHALPPVTQRPYEAQR